jgi:oligopeptide transport system substrate-binding protein
VLELNNVSANFVFVNTRLILILFLSVCRLHLATAAGEKVFRFHMMEEPSTLDPAKLESNEQSYLFSAVFAGLYKFDDKNGLIPVGAEKCEWSNSKKLRCTLNKSFKWSDGSPVVADHYIQAFRHVLDPATKSRDAELLFSLQGAQDIYKGQQPKDSANLGIQSQGDYELVFSFAKPDFEFEYKLVNPSLFPWKKLPDDQKLSANLYNGPYKMTHWQRGKKITLVSNDQFSKSITARPNIEILIVQDDTTALNLFENGTLTFLKRIPSISVAKYKSHPAFIQKQFMRFDYIGFGETLKAHRLFRKALALSVDYEELGRLSEAGSKAGCLNIPDKAHDGLLCLKFDLKAAKDALARVPEKIKSQKLILAFSAQGGDDIKRQSEWFQSQWLKNLGLKIEIQSFENKMHLQNLKLNIPSIFRKGVSIDRPTCLAALETFSEKNPENYIRFKNPAYERLLEQLNVNIAISKRKKICSLASRTLLSEFALIPMGPVPFSILALPGFKGWTLNRLNQLDLSALNWDTTNP